MKPLGKGASVWGRQLSGSRDHREGVRTLIPSKATFGKEALEASLRDSERGRRVVRGAWPAALSRLDDDDGWTLVILATAGGTALACVLGGLVMLLRMAL